MKLCTRGAISDGIASTRNRAWSVRGEIEVVDVATPLSYERYTGNWQGATCGFLLTKALYELERTGGRYGLVSMCCGGGLGTGTIIERL